MESQNLVDTRDTGYIDFYQVPQTSTVSRAIRWGKSGAKFQALESGKG